VVAQAGVAIPGRACPAELVVHRIDLHVAHRREGAGAWLQDGRRPALYGELVSPTLDSGQEKGGSSARASGG